LGTYGEIFMKMTVIIATLCVHRTQSVSAVFCPYFYHLPSVKQHCELQVPEK